jgi:hypothetical protein
LSLVLRQEYAVFVNRMLRRIFRNNRIMGENYMMMVR